jgi:hypothetical protein
MADNASSASAAASAAHVSASAAAGTKAAQAAHAPTQPAAASSGSHFSSMADLRQKNPELYKIIMLGIEQNMVTDMNHHQQDLAQVWKRMRYGD